MNLSMINQDSNENSRWKVKTRDSHKYFLSGSKNTGIKIASEEMQQIK